MVVYTIPHKLRRSSAVAIGNFDGFHLGHRRITERLAAWSRQSGHLSVILTFFPHPRIYFRHPVSLIFTEEQKKEILLRQHVDRFFFLDFARIQTYPAVQFIQEILIGCLRMKALVFSGDFLFGSGRTGNVVLLEKYAHRFGFELIEVEPVEIAGERVSSSAIRKKLLRGDIASANRMLGDPYRIDGTVERGEGRGRKLGFPTLNIRTANRLLPLGVFHTLIEIGGSRYGSVTNIGFRPTFGESESPRVETHIPGFKKRLYGRSIRLFFQDKIRDEIQFTSPEQLRRQIAMDITRIAIDNTGHF